MSNIKQWMIVRKGELRGVVEEITDNGNFKISWDNGIHTIERNNIEAVGELTLCGFRFVEMDLCHNCPHIEECCHLLGKYMTIEEYYQK